MFANDAEYQVFKMPVIGKDNSPFLVFGSAGDNILNYALYWSTVP